MFYLGTITDIAPSVMAQATAMNSAAASIAPNVQSLTSVGGVLGLLSMAEAEAGRTTNALVRVSTNRTIPAAYAAAYDGLRHALQGAQRAMLDMLRLQLKNQFGKSESDSVMAQIGFPAWLPRGDAMASVSIGDAPIFIGPRAEGFSAGHEYADATVATFREAAAKCVVVIGLAKGVKGVVTARAAGQAPSAGDAAAFAASEGFSLRKKLAIAIPTVLGVLALGGAAWWFIRRRKKSVRGIGRARPRRSLRGATKLTTLTDSTPSRYQLEV